MANVNPFASAQVVPAKKTKAKTEKPTVHIPGLETYADLVAVEKAIAALKETYKGVVETHMTDHFVTEGKRRQARPDNFKGSEGPATGSMELRKRSSRSTLNPDAIALLKQFGVSMVEEVDVEDTFIINPEYANDSKLLEKVGKAISGVKGVPADFILKQEGASRTVVAEEAIDEVFKLPEDAIRQLIWVVGTPAVKATTTKSLKDSMASMNLLVEEDDE